ncbi:hypothetical protein ODZ84_08070 [Chryseobacterium fluminis]|uniref:DUF6705 family protein n=1 Tax=Chryseobacterium fluminis TaxID=2983606 RepID=UPI0022514647|nr:DUF6705 family protein [Chryseobacterium sp. MMS21-Ot14]UZT99508.1 hypothetical protein ODZ84_08070 [Chryseobacterium sp. MMS21-Ot14]
MKNLFLILTLLYYAHSTAQQTVSLETIASCRSNPETCPDAQYVKDVNNLLNKYVGIWKGNLDGNNYEFNFIKKENVERGFDSIKWDRLIGRVKITSQNGSILFNNFNKPDNKANLGDNFQNDLKTYLVIFSGNKSGCIDSGYLYLRISPQTPNQMTITFHPDFDIVTQDCSHFKTTIPTGEKIYLTRQ